MQIVPVELADRSYEVTVGEGARHELARVVADAVPGARRAVVVTQEGIGIEVETGLPTEVFTVPDGESAKSLTVLEDLCRGFARSGLSRADVVVAVGGGVVTDLAGFAAASFHRGTPYINVATSLLAQVDAAIGGKTGVNIPEGKNLVGAFWQPSAVLCDTEVLETLPPREWASGRGEVAKYALLGISTYLGGPPTADQPVDDEAAPLFATADDDDVFVLPVSSGGHPEVAVEPVDREEPFPEFDDFAAADVIRDSLRAAGVIIEDTASGARFTLTDAPNPEDGS